MELAKDLDAFYIDTVVEPWPGLYTDQARSISERSNYALREGMLELRRRRPGGVTAVSCCGANPGMVSWMVKQALLDIARDLGIAHDEPQYARGLGTLDAARRRQGHPHRRARYPARRCAKAARRFRQYMVGRRIHRGRLAALRARLGHAREDVAARRTGITSSVATRRFISRVPARAHACARGRRLRRPSTPG